MRQFHDYNPLAVMLYYGCVVGITMFSMNPVILAVALVSSVLCFCLDPAGGRKSHLFSIALFLILFILNPLTVHKGATVLFYLNDRPVTIEAAVYGLCAAGMVTATLYRLRTFTKAMTADRLLYAFSRFSPKIALILSMAIRYVELFRIRWRRITDAQRALGLYRDGNLIDALCGRARVFSILVTWSLENGIITAESMDARGYGARRRTSFALYHIRPRDIGSMLITAGLTVLTSFGLTQAKVSYYPFIEWRLDSPLSIAGYISFGILSFMPIIINAKEAVKWRCLRSAR